MFRFKQFSLQHDRSTLKVGTDALLLGAWADLAGARRILDIGTGCGVLALIAAQRAPGAQVDAVETDLPSVEEAAANFAASPWPGRLRAHAIDARRLRSADRFDRILCNPPYYAGEMASTDERKRLARHASGLAPDELAAVIASLLEPSGHAALIIPADREKAFLDPARDHGLFPLRRASVHYIAHRPAKRVLVELGFRTGSLIEGPAMVVQDGTGTYSATYRSLMKDLLPGF
ncbi:MAG: methyltransferase [Flavobacteriales bacterium]|nr:methyltransferase [Flavobacteriales bacterium]